MSEMVDRGATLFEELLGRQCRVAPAKCGAVVRTADPGRAEVLATYPRATGDAPPVWLTAVLDLLSRGVVTEPQWLAPRGSGEPLLAVIPVLAGSPSEIQATLWAVYAVDDQIPGRAIVLERLILSAAALRAAAMQGEFERQGGEIDRLHRICSTLAGLAPHDRFSATAMALCNHLAAEWAANRVTLGVVHGPFVRAVAMSHTERLTRRSALVNQIEQVMEECADQDIEVVVPGTGQTVLSRVANEFAGQQGSEAVASIPLRRDGAVFGVLTLERPETAPFSPADLASLRMLADVVCAHVWLTHRYRRGVFSLLAVAARSGIASMWGPRYAWAKLGALAFMAAAVFFALVPGTYRVRADARLEAQGLRVVASPFDGFVVQTFAKAGDRVQAGQTLVMLDATEMLLRTASLRAELDGFSREAALAQREGKDAEALIAKAKARRAQADIAFLDRQIEQANVRTPIAGVVIAGDLDKQIGAPVKLGQTLFELAEPGVLGVEGFVTEDQIGDIVIGTTGTLSLLARPDVRLSVSIVRVNPLAELNEGRNVFRVVCDLDTAVDWLRPGMEGTLWLDAGEAPYPWIWSRRVANWVRMKLWI
jgi:biotin carboxyl carrier protein/GAF domain-containing protein